jgi:hypothetical protein
MSLNPELRRNLWLELTPTRLVVMPAVLCGVFVLTAVADGRRLGTASATVALTLFVGLTWVWGAHLAAESVLSELRGRTWDWQRMSGIGPWPLAWGKLAGSTAYPWYGAVLCLALFAAADHGEVAQPGRLVALLLLGGLLSQVVALLAAVQAATRDRTFTRAQSTAWLVLAALVLYPLITAGFAVSRIDWFGTRFEPQAFALRSIAAFLAFAAMGLWVQLRRELKVRTLPLAWPAFSLFLMAWVAGFTMGERLPPPGYPLLAALVVAVTLTWATAFGERKDPVALRRLLRALREERWRRAAEEAPSWLLTLPLVLALAGLLAAAPALLGEADLWSVRWTLIAGLGFLGRDLALLIYLNLGVRPRRADLFAAVLLLVGYVLVPLVFAALEWKAAMALLLPIPEHAPIAAASGLAQCAALGVMLVRRWRERERAVEALAAPVGDQG